MRDRDFDRDLWIQRSPNPGVAAVLSALIPGLGQVYAGRIGAGAVWLLVTMVAYRAILIPGFLFHLFCIYSAYESARSFDGY